jgi:hypothetical protein
MKLLVRSARDFGRLWSANLGLSLWVGGVVFAVEVAGRESRESGTDLHDLLFLFVLAVFALLVLGRHRRVPLPWVTLLAGAGRRLGGRLRRATFEIGLDLRGHPRVRRGTPPVILWLAGTLAAWAALAALGASGLPHGLRAALTQVWYVGYLLLLAALWLGLSLLSVLAFFLPAALIHDACVGAHTGPRPRRREFLALAGYFGSLVLLGALLPVAVALVWCGLALFAYLAVCWLPARADVRFLWRPHGTVRVRSLSWSRWVTWEFLLITLAVFALVLTACGDRAYGGTAAAETMPVTAMLGLTLAWLAPGALTTLLVQMALGRLRDPARPDTPAAHVTGAPRSRRRWLRRLFRRHGWGVHFAPARPGPLDVGLAWVESRPATADDEPRWPLAVAAEDLADPGFWERLRRRDEVQKRRKLVGTLERLFKLAAGKPARAGSGYWVAPHFWFVAGLMRDSQRDADEDFDLADGSILSGTVGPPYFRLLPRGARHHLYRLLRAVQVDLIFVEDGVSFRRFRRVLRALFEVYDVHGGRRPAEEIDFRGLPGTRVLIHEFQFDEPFKSEVYPEPKYDYLGRARILHVFRDRGEQEEPLETPFDFSRTPAPVAVG